MRVEVRSQDLPVTTLHVAIATQLTNFLTIALLLFRLLCLSSARIALKLSDSSGE
jgi:hypothetical protein